MQAVPRLSVSTAEAQAFADRLGLKTASAAELEQVRQAMESAAESGRAVPRVSSKFDAPAPVFRVTSIKPTRQKEP